MPRALFFPSCRGGGFGHISRCLALASELSTQGWDTALLVEGPHADRVRRDGYQLVGPRRRLGPLHRWLRRLRPRGGDAQPTYVIVSDMNFQIVRDGFYTPQAVRARVEQELRLIEDWRPDALIGDTWPLTSIVGQRARLPVVQIIKSIVHPACPNLIWWDRSPPNLISPDIRPVFNPVLAKWDIPPIERAEDLLTGDLLLVPSIPELDPLPGGLSNTHYVGPLTRRDPRSMQPADWFEQLSTDRPLVYVSIGGGADPVGGPRLFQILYEALEDLPIQVVTSTSAKFKPSNLPTPPANFVLKNWVPGPAMIARSDAVVFHGGYGTMMEAVHCGVPSVIIPFHTEQEANGRRLEANGVGVVVLHSAGPYEPAWVQWPWGPCATLVAPRSTLDPHHLRLAVNRVLSEERFRLNATRLKGQLAKYSGPTQAANLIENLLHQRR